jgi:hypothetical protein
VDDMAISRHEDAVLRQALTAVGERLLGDETLVSSELNFSSGVIMAVRRW